MFISTACKLALHKALCKVVQMVIYVILFKLFLYARAWIVFLGENDIHARDDPYHKLYSAGIKKYEDIVM